MLTIYVHKHYIEAVMDYISTVVVPVKRILIRSHGCSKMVEMKTLLRPAIRFSYWPFLKSCLLIVTGEEVGSAGSTAGLDEGAMWMS